MAAAGAGVGGGGDHDFPLEEVDAVLAYFTVDPASVFGPLPAPEAGASLEPAVAGESLREGLGEVEKFLMKDYEDETALDGVDEFLDSVLVGNGEDDGSPKSTGGERSADGAFPGEDEMVGEDCGDDPDSKKKRRQMRNRDSAIKSRERKKLYVKGLEMKSKYLEAECCRLSYALQCCTAENMVLRQSLLNRPVGAPTAMQKSAVLTETLPLVSLLWLVSIVCLLLTLCMPNRSLVAPSNLGRDLVKPARTSINEVKMTRSTRAGDDPRTLRLIRLGRHCRGTRVRIKSHWVTWHPATAC